VTTTIAEILCFNKILWCNENYVFICSGEHGSPLQYNNCFVGFIKFVLTYIFYHYLRASNERPYI